MIGSSWYVVTLHKHHTWPVQRPGYWASRHHAGYVPGDDGLQPGLSVNEMINGHWISRHHGGCIMLLIYRGGHRMCTKKWWTQQILYLKEILEYNWKSRHCILVK